MLIYGACNRWLVFTCVINISYFWTTIGIRPKYFKGATFTSRLNLGSTPTVTPIWITKASDNTIIIDDLILAVTRCKFIRAVGFYTHQVQPYNTIAI